VRVLCTAFPAIGHLHPLLPLAVAARNAGHEVCVATAPDLVPWTVTCGVPARPVGPLVRHLLARTDPRHPERLLTDAWPDAVTADLTRLVEEWRPDVVVHEEGEYAALLVATRLGVPCATQSWATPARSPFERAEAVNRLGPLWERTGAAAVREPRVTGDLYLDACPPPFQLGGLRGVENAVPVRAVPFDGPAQAAPPWLAQMERPAAYVTLGADPEFSRRELLRQLVAAIAPLVSTVVLTTGPHDPRSLGQLPPNVRARAYLPQSLVLPNVALVVSQGGAGPLVGSLLQAVPHLVLPAHDQRQQAVASVTAGIGTGLRLPADQVTPDAVAAAVIELLSDLRFELAASKVRAQVERLPGPEQVLELVLGLAG
jgi:UDP:flavonoid glycosyltransferase YjiC (YdhE family)